MRDDSHFMLCVTASLRASWDSTTLEQHHHHILNSLTTSASIASLALATTTAAIPTVSTAPLLKHEPSLSSSSPSSSFPSTSGINGSTGGGRSLRMNELMDSLMEVDNDVRPAKMLSMNTELERLLGYSRDDMTARTKAVGIMTHQLIIIASFITSNYYVIIGWCTDILLVDPNEAAQLWQYTIGAVLGLNSQWSIVANVLTKVICAPSLSASCCVIWWYVMM
jgi:hypothetical protein